MNKKKTGVIAAAVTLTMVCGTAIYLMAHRSGLQDDLDFGAGAYYYTDIPDFEKYMKWDAFQAGLPFWVYVVLFLLWGALMYRLWIWIDKKNK